MKKVIDISYWQQQTDMTRIKRAGIDGVYIKSTEGSGRIEPMAMGQAEKAISAGIAVGYYHFSHIDQLHPAEEAVRFASRLEALPPADMLPVLDIETNKSNLKPLQVLEWIRQFAATLATLGHPQIMLYSYQPFLDSNLPISHDLGHLPLWIAQYRNDDKQPTLPRGWKSYALWQYTSKGKIDGVTGDVDVNVCTELPLI